MSHMSVSLQTVDSQIYPFIPSSAIYHYRLLTIYHFYLLILYNDFLKIKFVLLSELFSMSWIDNIICYSYEKLTENVW